MTDLTALLERVRSATGADRELDGLIGWHVDGWHTPICPNPTDVHYMIVNNGLPVSTYTASIDAALALTERVLPEANCKGVEYDPASGWCAYVSRNHVATGHWLKEAYAPTAPLAIIAATLQALIAKDTQP